MLKHNLLMSLDRSLSLHTAALAILGAMFVGRGQESIFVPAVTVLAAVAAVIVTDSLGWLRLNRWLANLIYVVAVGWSLREFFHIQSEEKLMAIANMLCYLQVVLLFQKKSLRVLWQLVVLSMLQVVVGTALDAGPQFGLLLAVCAVVGLSILVLLCMYRETQPGTTSRVAASSKTLPAWQALLAEPQVEAGTASEIELRRSLTPAILTRQTALLSAVTLLFAVVFFYATPRLNDPAWQGHSSAAGVSGFRPEVRIAERGRIHLSSHAVMRATLSRMSDRKPLMLVGEPYFHGEILTEYRTDERGSSWRPVSATSLGRGQRWGPPPMAAQTTTNLVRQDIVQEASNSSRRFAIMPTQGFRDLALVRYGHSPPARETSVVSRQQRFSTATPAIRSQRQVHAIPNPNRLLTPADGAAFGEEERQTLAIDRERFPRLIEQAAAALQQQDLSEGKPFDKALALERHFLTPDSYHYSLNLDFPRDVALDPIEDFVANHRTGHCQYFASALALMLRSQGIPARIIVGYKGGEFNSVGQYYVVQERHSHAWVEAWLSNDEVPDWELAGVPSEGGAWYRLDPTPGRDSFVAIAEPGVGQRLAQAFDYVELLWRDYVLSLNNDRQEDLVFAPLTANLGSWPSWIESRSFRGWLRRLSQGLGFQPRRGGRGGGRAFDGPLAALVIGGILSLLAAVQASRLAARALAPYWRKRRHAAHSAAAPEFYLRLERLLAGLPLARGAGQTPRELAAAAQRRLVAVEGAALSARVPAEVVAAYYRVRFGGARLDKNEMQAIEQALASLAPAVRQAKACQAQTIQAKKK
jgi:hypothetical protein